MTAWMYRFLIIGLAFFGITPASRHATDDQPGVLNVHLRDYCDPVTFAAMLAVLAGLVLWGIGYATQDTLLKAIIAGMLPLRVTAPVGWLGA